MKTTLCMVAVVMIAAALAAPAYAQPASPAAASAQGEAPELRVAARVRTHRLAIVETDMIQEHEYRSSKRP